eukprot:g1153.t1
MKNLTLFLALLICQANTFELRGKGGASALINGEPGKVGYGAAFGNKHETHSISADTESKHEQHNLHSVQNTKHETHSTSADTESKHKQHNVHSVRNTKREAIERYKTEEINRSSFGTQQSTSQLHFQQLQMERRNELTGPEDTNGYNFMVIINESEKNVKFEHSDLRLFEEMIPLWGFGEVPSLSFAPNEDFSSKFIDIEISKIVLGKSKLELEGQHNSAWIQKLFKKHDGYKAAKAAKAKKAKKAAKAAKAAAAKAANEAAAKAAEKAVEKAAEKVNEIEQAIAKEFLRFHDLKKQIESNFDLEKRNFIVYDESEDEETLTLLLQKYLFSNIKIERDSSGDHLLNLKFCLPKYPKPTTNTEHHVTNSKHHVTNRECEEFIKEERGKFIISNLMKGEKEEERNLNILFSSWKEVEKKPEESRTEAEIEHVVYSKLASIFESNSATFDTYLDLDGCYEGKNVLSLAQVENLQETYKEKKMQYKKEWFESKFKYLNFYGPHLGQIFPLSFTEFNTLRGSTQNSENLEGLKTEFKIEFAKAFPYPVLFNGDEAEAEAELKRTSRLQDLIVDNEYDNFLQLPTSEDLMKLWKGEAEIPPFHYYIKRTEEKLEEEEEKLEEEA